MAATIAYAAGYNKHNVSQSREVSRLGHGYAVGRANTWRTFTTAHVYADGHGYISVTRDGRTLHYFEFGEEERSNT